MATTHVDRHNERVAKDELENVAEQINKHEEIQWITWNHQTTLPPIAYVDRAWVEQLEDGEYGLFFEATALTEGENLVIIEDLEITQDELDHIHLGIAGIPGARPGRVEELGDNDGVFAVHLRSDLGKAFLELFCQ